MCGITGIYAFNEAGRFHLVHLQRSVDAITHRGPDSQGSFFIDRIGLGHRRLAIIDTSSDGNQPMKDVSGNYTIVYNGEIYNFKEIKDRLIKDHHINFRSTSDTEVLLYAYIIWKEGCLEMLNGFFAFAVYNQNEESLFIARDRFGIKPLYYYLDDDKLLFASELRSLLAYGIEKSLNYAALNLYFRLNYIPAPFSIINGVQKLLPGHSIKIEKNKFSVERYFKLKKTQTLSISFKEQKAQLLELIQKSVSDRLISDVPLGVFLSGGIDSSIIAAIASKQKSDLQTFGIGYQQASFFDEKKYGQEVANHFGTQHHVFDLSNNDLLTFVNPVLDHFDEPFADSSAIPVYILAEMTRKHVTVALSGDGADEIFTGYNKHRAFYKSLSPGLFNTMSTALGPISKALPQSRNDSFSNKIRQLSRYASGLKLSTLERYWYWASFLSQTDAVKLFLNPHESNLNQTDIKQLSSMVGIDSDISNMDEFLMADISLVLPNDMLHKVDQMSMAHGLEVRVPFLDQSIVEYGMNLPDQSRFHGSQQKRILREILKELLPGKLHKRSKHGFEVPLLPWFRKELKSLITNDLLSEAFIREQEIFAPIVIKNLVKRLFSNNPGDSHATIWALLVFQHWWKKYLN